MFTKSFVLAAVMLASAASLAGAQEAGRGGFDPNMANRYPAYAEPAGNTQQATGPHKRDFLRSYNAVQTPAATSAQPWIDNASRSENGGGN